MDIKRNYAVETTLTAQKVCQLINDGKVNDLPLVIPNTLPNATPITITNNVSIQYGMYATTIDSTHVLIIYDESTTYNSKAVVAKISGGNTITLGTPVTMETNIYASIKSASTLDSTHVIVSYYSGQTPQGIRAGVLTISDTTIVVGAFVQVVGGNTYQAPNIACIDSTRAIIVYTAGSVIL